jgi:hypothetical protein
LQEGLCGELEEACVDTIGLCRLLLPYITGTKPWSTKGVADWLHNANPKTPIEETMHAMAELQK